MAVHLTVLVSSGAELLETQDARLMPHRLVDCGGLCNPLFEAIMEKRATPESPDKNNILYEVSIFISSRLGALNWKNYPCRLHVLRFECRQLMHEQLLDFTNNWLEDRLDLAPVQPALAKGKEM